MRSSSWAGSSVQILRTKFTMSVRQISHTLPLEVVDQKKYASEFYLSKWKYDFYDYFLLDVFEPLMGLE